MKTYPVTIVEIGTVALGQEAMLRAAHSHRCDTPTRSNWHV